MSRGVRSPYVARSSNYSVRSGRRIEGNMVRLGCWSTASHLAGAAALGLRSREVFFAAANAARTFRSAALCPPGSCAGLHLLEQSGVLLNDPLLTADGSTKSREVPGRERIETVGMRLSESSMQCPNVTDEVLRHSLTRIAVELHPD